MKSILMIPALAVLQSCLMGRAAEPLPLDLTAPQPGAISGHLGLGTTNAPGGHSLWADSRCLYRDGKPFIPVMGEFHFSRYPADEWREALLKMKAGGIDIVATYVFWIHHEEEQGKYDWTGQRSLRDFLQTCRELDLLAVVRMGPWAHGEVRNGGFPDWIQNAPFWDQKEGLKDRTTHPEFMSHVGNHYREIAGQMKGLLWKDGGPVIGVQHDNECGNLPYLLALKKLARDCGIDVPFYTMTGWNAVPISDGELLPLFGGYADGFWVTDPLPMRKSYLFTPIRDDGDMGAINGRLANTRPDRGEKIQRFPYLCCEIGGGMPSSHDVRVQVSPRDVAALALVKLGSGNNLPGYYMYQGGVNPDGRLTTLNETKATHYPNDLAVKDYDFNAPLGAAGQARGHYFLLRQQHLFLAHFGDRLARMPAFFPEPQVASLDDRDTLRWSVRSDGESGFVFFNNHQRYQQLPDKRGIQFAMKTKSRNLILPKQPITIPSGSFGVFPFNLDCAGVRLDYATAQPLCFVEHAGAQWFFFGAIAGIDPEFAFEGKPPRPCRPGPEVAFSLKSPRGTKVYFVVLDATESAQLSRQSIAGHSFLAISPNALLTKTAAQLTIETLGNEQPSLALFPPIKEVLLGTQRFGPKSHGIFTSVKFPVSATGTQLLDAEPRREAEITPQPRDAMQESSWRSAATWSLAVRPRDRNSILRLSYVGDVIRIYAGGRLLMDQFYNGQTIDMALWRVPSGDLEKLEVQIMPLHKGFPRRLPESARPEFGETISRAELLGASFLRKRHMDLTIVR